MQFTCECGNNDPAQFFHYEYVGTRREIVGRAFSKDGDDLKWVIRSIPQKTVHEDYRNSVIICSLCEREFEAPLSDQIEWI